MRYLQSEVVRLKELPFVFTGSLPAETNDETRMPRQQLDEVDLMSPTESTRALVLDVGRRGSDRSAATGCEFQSTQCCRTMVQQLRFDYEEAS